MEAGRGGKKNRRRVDKVGEGLIWKERKRKKENGRKLLERRQEKGKGKQNGKGKQ